MYNEISVYQVSEGFFTGFVYLFICSCFAKEGQMLIVILRLDNHERQQGGLKAFLFISHFTFLFVGITEV
jgi:hypothetical protein